MKFTSMSVMLIAPMLALPNGTHAASITYGSVGIIAGSDVDHRFMATREACMLEASTPPRGNPRLDNFYNQASLRACLYRHGFSSNGDYVYPVPLFGSPTRTR